MTDFNELRKEIFTNGRIDEGEVERLNSALFEDGEGMTMEKGNFLFNVKDRISPEHRTSHFNHLFINAISSLLLEDEISPGEIDDNEAKWLRGKIQSKGYHDDLDNALLDNLKNRSINFPHILHYKGKYARCFEKGLYFSRYLTMFAVIGSICSAIALFIKGTFIVSQGLWHFFKSFSQTDQGDYEIILATFVSSVDIYLFAMVLIIFGVGIYELFINKIDPVERMVDERPSWLQVSSIDDLKSSLGKVILMVLIVSFFKHSIDIPYESSKDLLLMAVGVVLIALSLLIASRAHILKKENQTDKD